MYVIGYAYFVGVDAGEELIVISFSASYPCFGGIERYAGDYGHVDLYGFCYVFSRLDYAVCSALHLPWLVFAYCYLVAFDYGQVYFFAWMPRCEHLPGGELVGQGIVQQYAARACILRQLFYGGFYRFGTLLFVLWCQCGF